MHIMLVTRCIALCVSLLMAPLAFAGTLVIHAPGPVESATATAEGDSAMEAKVQDTTAMFSDVPTDVPVTAAITLSDGSTLQGVSLHWHSDEPAKPDAGELTDDDREQIRAIVQDVPSFYNKSDILLLEGDHDRAVALVQLVRDSDFHAGKGEVVWRVELYSFKFQFGGWEKVQQQNRILRRERFKTVDEFKTVTGKLKWVQQLGGVIVGKDETKTITLKN